MNTSESLGYLKGLVDGIELDTSTKEGKAIKAIIDVLDNIIDDVQENAEDIENIYDEIDDVEDDIIELEDAVYDDDYEDDDFDDDDDYEEYGYEIECPNCHDTFEVDADTAESGEVVCPNCGEKLQFEFTDDEDDGDEE